MTTEEHLKKMIEMFKSLPDPKHQPKKFKFLVETYMYLNK